MKVMGARALVKRLEEKKPESSLIEIPETVLQKPSPFALVLAVGKLEQGGFGVGDTVVLRDFAGAPADVLVDGQVVEAMVVPESDVLAVLEP